MCIDQNHTDRLFGYSHTLPQLTLTKVYKTTKCENYIQVFLEVVVHGLKELVAWPTSICIGGYPAAFTTQFLKAGETQPSLKINLQNL